MSKQLYKPHPKQDEFHAAVNSGKYQVIFFGGGAGGGKTYAAIAHLILLCKIFPKSIWCVVRQDYSKLKDTSILTFWKIVPDKFLRGFSRGIAEFRNGSKIIFKGENIKHYKELTNFDGFECNGFVLEEVQELNKKMFEKAKLRAGRNILEPPYDMPPPIVILTGNPSATWSKDLLITPWKEGKLNDKYCVIPATMSDNPSLPETYKEGMDTLDEFTYQRYVLGNWDVIDVDKPFAYSFDAKKTVKEFKGPVKRYPLYLSFDFNLDPITAIVCQHNGSKIRIHDEFRLADSNTEELCHAIKNAYPGFYYIITGDAAGLSGSTVAKKNVNNYTIIKQILDVTHMQMKVPKRNPFIRNSRVLCNSLLSKHPDYKIHPRCKYLIEDLQYVEVNTYGEIDKTKDKRRTHLLDCWRYYHNTHHPKFIKNIF